MVSFMVLTTITTKLTPLYFYWNNVDHNLLLLLVIANAAIDLIFPLFTLFSLSLSLSLSKLILSFTTFLSLDHSSHSLLFSFFSFSVWYVLDLKLFFLFLFLFFFSISQGHHPLNRIKSVLWVFKVLSRRRCPSRVALVGNYLRQFWVFWGVRCNGFWYSVLSEIILGCSGGFDSKCFEQCGPLFG